MYNVVQLGHKLPRVKLKVGQLLNQMNICDNKHCMLGCIESGVKTSACNSTEKNEKLFVNEEY